MNRNWGVIKQCYDDFISSYDSFMLVSDPSPELKKDLLCKYDKARLSLVGGCGNIVRSGFVCPHRAARDSRLLYCKRCRDRIGKLDRLNLIIIGLK